MCKLNRTAKKLVIKNLEMNKILASNNPFFGLFSLEKKK